MRIATALIVLSLLVVPHAFAEAPVVVLKLTSVHAALDDIETFGAFEDPEAERERFLGEIVSPLSLPLGDWLDRNRPVVLTTTMPGMGGNGTSGVVLLLPVLDNADALAALGGDIEAEPEDGIHELERADGEHWFVISEDDYLTIGMNRDRVAGFERDRLQSLDLPPGNIAAEINMETVTPMLQGLIGMQRMQMKQAMEQAQAQAQQEGSDVEEAPSPEAVLGMTDFYFESALTVLRNTARFQVALDSIGSDPVFRIRVVPAADSPLEELLAEQPTGFSKLARAVPEQPALVTYAAHYELTDTVRDGMMAFMDQYAGALEQLSGMMPEMEWMAQMMGDQQEAARQRMACIGGEAAGVWEMGGEEGFRSIQLSSVPDSPECEGLAETEIETMAKLLGPGGEPLMTTSEPNVAPGNVRATRIELHMDRMVQGDEATAAIMESMLGSRGPVSFYGQTETATVSVSGPGAEETFTDVVDRLQSRRKKGGLTEELFLPLQAGAGLFVAVDTSRFDLDSLLEAVAPDAGAEEAEEEAKEEEATGGRIVFGLFAERGRLAVDLTLPASMLHELFADDDPHGPPADLWPPPPAPAEGASKEEAAKQEGAQLPVAGSDDVTLPVLRHEIAPDYPEIMTEHGLQGRITLQAIVDKEGAVKSLEPIRCDGQSMDDPGPRENLLLASNFCTTFSDAATAAVERWRYEPARQGDEPVDVYFTVQVDFELE